MRFKLVRLTTIAALTFGASIVMAQDTAVVAGDDERGQTLFRKCAACHQVGEGAKNRVGPQLNGIIGAKAGSVKGFPYSKAFKQAFEDGLIWDLAQLDGFIENPKSMIPKTRMNYRGLKKPQDRLNVIAYLQSFSEETDAKMSETPAEVTLPAEVLALDGDPEYGEYLASECLTCHQLDGSAQGIPVITQWPREDFVIAMHAYKQKIRPHPVMQMMASRLSNDEIAALAAYFESLE